MTPDLPPALREHVALGPLSSLGTGGTARWFCEARDLPTLRAAVSWAQRRGVPLMVLGGGSNVVFTDGLFDGLVCHVELLGQERLTAPAPNIERQRIGAGEPWDAFVAGCCAAGLAGVECLSGIPGSVGATPIQNVGAYGQEVCQVVHSVRCLDARSLEVVDVPNEACGFAYRSSRFKHGDLGHYVVLAVEFDLRRDGAPTLEYAELVRAVADKDPSLPEVRRIVLELRAQKSMLLDTNDPNGRSCGSFFVNCVLGQADFARLCERARPHSIPHFPQADGTFKVPSARLIQQAGFGKGHREGHVGLSTKHTLCVVAHEGATSEQVVAFARRVRDRVWQELGVCLQPEPVFVGIEW